MIDRAEGIWYIKNKACDGLIGKRHICMVEWNCEITKAWNFHEISEQSNEGEV